MIGFKQHLEACWTGYKQIGTKKKGNRMVPNCVPEEAGSVEEAAYEGNIGMMELAKFYQKSTDFEKKNLQNLIKKQMFKDAWKLIQAKTGTKLIGKEFATESICQESKDFSKYTMKPVKTEPKIVRKTNPSGRTTDHVEYEVHGTLSSHKKTFKSKKEAEAYFNTVKEEAELGEGSESWEAGYSRRVVKTSKPEHKEKGYNWRIKGKDRPEISIKLYKEKPSQAEFNKQMKRVAGHEFGG